MKRVDVTNFVMVVYFVNGQAYSVSYQMKMYLSC